MELKSISDTEQRNSRNSINRTFMELKYGGNVRGIVSNDVLIEPLWN